MSEIKKQTTQRGRDATARKRSAAKTGMVLSLGALAATGLMRGRGARTLHIWSGISMVAFSIWHYSLYRPAGRKPKP